MSAVLQSPNFIYFNHKAMNPTQFELASLAAQTAGKATPEEKIGAAMALWNAAGLALKPQPPDPSYNCTRDMKKILAELMPRTNSKTREQRYGEYLFAQNHGQLWRVFQNCPKYITEDGIAPRLQNQEDVEKEARTMTDRMLGEQRLNGVPYSTQTAEEFREWDRKRKNMIAVDRAKKGGHGKRKGKTGVSLTTELTKDRASPIK